MSTAQPEQASSNAVDESAPIESPKLEEGKVSSSDHLSKNKWRHVATFIDIDNVSGAAVAVEEFNSDIKLGDSQVVCIITSYSLCFATFLLFAGRLSDLFPAQISFEAGFFGLGVVSLITSFVTSNKYGFLILRGLGGICGSMIIVIAEILQIFSDGGPGNNYWGFCFPAFIIGSFGAMLVYFASGISIITYCAPEMAGVAGAWVIVLAQVGGAITMIVQAGLQDTSGVIPQWSKSGSRT
ncbi:uncharacterized protein I206_104055 [Kwoniella pini CBS 10737]|uniref:Major facilitator superfamily (MFS) profile domain-containing protein n=1 Tax=Kwoniella pini CBS 10737 TaxID=1296096 RepID=A0A1B9I2S2_9TREE|nr:uncharacterized protein I206_04369 [Kwoniella pini CBS 10737]OCF49842.1 hypothetical protein I206_04369 [Kwoniella pini CBS 10737]